MPFPPTSERFERLEEAIHICLKTWSDDNGPYEGKHYKLAETLCEPKPLSQPRPRILIGGDGERKTLRIVAQYADACNIIGDPQQVAHKLDVLRRHCDALGRDINEIEVTVSAHNLSPTPTRDEVLTVFEDCAKLGVATIVTRATSDDPAGWLEDHIGSVMDEIRAIQPAKLSR